MINENFLSFSSLILLMGIFLNHLNGQEGKAYYFDDDEVVFQFDSRTFQKAYIDGHLAELDFADLEIYEVILSGNFNNWNKDDWKMKKVGPYTFELRKKLSDFKDEYTWEFKFIINDKFWVNPNIEKYNTNVLERNIWEDIFGVKLYDVEPANDGNVTFFHEGDLNAREVILTGDFNGWNEHYLRMNRIGNGWQLKLNLAPGRYEYKFIVDKEWTHDLKNPEKTRNIHRTFNSVLRVTQETTFSLKGFPNARRVILAGSFNNWKTNDIKLRKTASGWSINKALVGGKHYYKFIVDGAWMTDPENPLTEYDRRGNINSVLIVR